jgi:hypothetical protein
MKIARTRSMLPTGKVRQGKSHTFAGISVYTPRPAINYWPRSNYIHTNNGLVANKYFLGL